MESARLHQSGLCVDAQRVERSVQGVPGPAGVRGPQGPAGVDGRDGVNGSAGERGPAGVNGSDGKNGKDGKDGRSVVSVYCSGGRLAVKYSDGGVSTVSGSVACGSVKPSPVVTVSSHK